MFETWAPKLFEYYDQCAGEILKGLENAPKISVYLPYLSITVNFGPQTICNIHRDLMNLAWGWCAILILGNFNPVTGGHIVLHEPKLILEVYPGDVVFIPSACVAHETIPIGEKETRYSVTWYTSSGAFQWVAAGGKTLTMWKKENPEEAGPDGKDGEAVWKDGCDMLSTKEYLEQRYGNHG